MSKRISKILAVFWVATHLNIFCDQDGYSSWLLASLIKVSSVVTFEANNRAAQPKAKASNHNTYIKTVRP